MSATCCRVGSGFCNCAGRLHAKLPAGASQAHDMEGLILKIYYGKFSASHRSRYCEGVDLCVGRDGGVSLTWWGGDEEEWLRGFALPHASGPWGWW